MISIFEEGKTESIDAVLAQKDQRVALQEKLLSQNHQAILVDVKLNIPGPIKNNRYLTHLFEVGIASLENRFKQNHLSFHLATHWNQSTGCENFYLISSTSANKVKMITVSFEASTPLGRLFDADVFSSDQVQAWSRTALNLPVRYCFLCGRPAKECARSRRHSVSQLQDYIAQIYDKEVIAHDKSCRCCSESFVVRSGHISQTWIG